MLSEIIKAAEAKFGEVLAAKKTHPGAPACYELTIKRIAPADADRPFMKITAYQWAGQPPAFEHGHYDLTAEAIKAPDFLSIAGAAYGSILRLPPKERLDRQFVLASLRYYIAGATGRSGEDVQNDFEQQIS